MSTTTLTRTTPPASRSDAGVALWVFIGVATTLFALFIMAYVMRMAGSDWSSIALPWQLGLATALLAAGSAAMALAARAAQRADGTRARAMLLAGGACAAAFLGAQLWGWAALLEAHVLVNGNPAASFFYLLTAMHGLHVIGGLIAWGFATRAPAAIVLCARYWHFLLAVWLVLLATLAGVTPAFVAWACGPLGVVR
ncbi:MAG TPA: bb3-type cytochrome oxidase subunit III [Burkholderiaceae bacterium]|nr:bb3-type cytochrome oxidase subunit III [Burkholderiaceae bacterium]